MILDKYKHIDYDFRDNTISEKNGRADDFVEIIKGATWQNTEYGRALAFNFISKYSKYSIPHNSYQDMTGLSGITLIALGDFRQPTMYERILSKRSSGQSFDFFFQDSGSTAYGLKWYDGVTGSSTLNLTSNDFKDCRMVAGSLTVGSKPRYSLNGIFKGEGDIALQIPVTTNDTFIGTYGFTIGGGETSHSNYQRVIVVFEALSDGEILEI